MTIDERIAQKQSDLQAHQQQLDLVDKQLALLQQRRETLVLACHRIDGAISAFNEVKADEEESQ